MNMKCELLTAVQREILHARAIGRRYVLANVDTILEAMQYDHRGGIEQLAEVLDEIAKLCHCRYTRQWKNHMETITFVLIPKRSFA